MRTRLSLILVFGLFAACATLSADPLTTWAGTVTRVLDGDTVEVSRDGVGLTKVRLYGIDAPELSQAFGIQAKIMLEALTLGKRVIVIDHGPDLDGRKLGDVAPVNGFVTGPDVAVVLLNAGLAWWYSGYAPERIDLASIEVGARKGHIGLFDVTNPVPPWVFRNPDLLPDPPPIAVDGWVYITKSGDAYHRFGCSTIRTYISAPIPKNSAILLDKDPCKVCKPG